ncbi:hypothetical protein LNKW23_33160 [Paralimibaculum aggregatum]|uniref:DUF1508 domain-containing protein n=1 Tax=Paralimibaculum aggregatum TaxID=3036245 RepID=A0ABQ6LMB0_9RHOB|nr:DUF1508 domain-containing protein [Limibaculum sp. NKW23]GMG84102.1 hypothetical protein LNKW23_33160 [Limibaculum sp. NKW23]
MAAGEDRFEIFRDKRGNYRWRRIDGEGGVVGASSEGYVSRSDCEANMNRGPVPSDKWDFYIDKRGAFRWRRYARNGRVVGAASRGFATRAEAEANARRQGFES